jgi:hypothetical protein
MMPERSTQPTIRRSPNARSNLERPLNDETLRRPLCARSCAGRTDLTTGTSVAGMEPLHLVVVANLVSTLVLTGIIWTVQLVHYPLMALVGRDAFVSYEASHSPRMAAVVVLPWTVQGITTAWLLVERPAAVGAPLVWSGAVAAALTVIVTVAWSVPAHERLARGFDERVHARLVQTNWLRTVAWTTHATIAALIAVRTFGGDGP